MMSNFKKILHRFRTNEHRYDFLLKQWQDVFLMAVLSAFSDAFCPRARLIYYSSSHMSRKRKKKESEKTRRHCKINVESRECSIVANTSTKLGRQAFDDAQQLRKSVRDITFNAPRAAKISSYVQLSIYLALELKLN